MVKKTIKKMDFVIEIEDFKNLDKNSLKNFGDSFENYLKAIDKEEKLKKDNNGKEWTIEDLIKIEKDRIKLCKNIISGEVSSIDKNGKMSSLNSTEEIIIRLINQVSTIILIRKKICELEKKED